MLVDYVRTYFPAAGMSNEINTLISQLPPPYIGTSGYPGDTARQNSLVVPKLTKTDLWHPNPRPRIPTHRPITLELSPRLAKKAKRKKSK
jgi:hypothetical protein